MYSIISNKNTTTAHDLETASKASNQPKHLSTIASAIIDNKQIFNDAYTQIKEEVGNDGSFIPELDIGKDGIPTEWKEQSIAIQAIVASETAIAEKDFLHVLNENKQDGAILTTEWTAPSSKVNIRTKYFFSQEQGIIVKELKATPTKESYIVAVPTLKGLAGFRAELNNNPDTENFNDLVALHNNTVLLQADIEPEQQIFYDLAEVRDDEPSSRFYAKGGIFINFSNGLINSIKNEKQQAPIKTTRREF